MRSGSGVFSATGISLWPTEEVAAMVVTVSLLFNDSDNVSDIFLFVLRSITPYAAFASVNTFKATFVAILVLSLSVLLIK